MLAIFRPACATVSWQGVSAHSDPRDSKSSFACDLRELQLDSCCKTQLELVLRLLKKVLGWFVWKIVLETESRQEMEKLIVHFLVILQV